jgi:hypothetical protein
MESFGIPITMINIFVLARVKGLVEVAGVYAGDSVL